MARQKKKNRQVKSPAEKSGGDNVKIRESVPVQADSTVPPNENEEKQAVCPGRRQVSLSTCLGGMFLCLVLGVYIGTLLPDMLTHYQHSGQSAHMDSQADSANAGLPAMPQASSNDGAKARDASDRTLAGMPRDIKDRIAQLEGIVAAKPTDSAAWTELGNLFFDTGQVEKSIHAYEHSLALDPRNADVLTDLGIMHREAGNTLKAVECFRKATAIDPSHLNALFNEGVVLSSDLGDKAGAKEAWEKLLKINPEASGPDGKSVREMIQGLR